MEAVIFVGTQATGKSTFYWERFFRTHVRISLDMLRTRHREKRLLETCLDIRQPFVVDNTNPTAEDRRKYIDAARKAGFKVLGFYFQSKIDDCVRRNLDRPEFDQIPERGVRGTHARLELPEITEGFEQIHYVRIDPVGGFLVEDWNQ